ncbi:hypothetical protein HON22_04550, partial [Candidatus Peregrinibacteria bacterium]|nr:hypothetical protein [Candidatus Peregrinibacteria bacterium]
MSNTLRKSNGLPQKANNDETKDLNQESESSNLTLLETAQQRVLNNEASRKLKSVDLSKTENYRLRREKDLLLDQLSQLNIDIDNKKNEFECAKASMQDKVDNKQLVITKLENQELKYNDHIQRLSEQISLLKIELEDNERKIKINLDEAKCKEKELKSNYTNIQKSINESAQTSNTLVGKIENQEKKLLNIGLLVEEKKISLTDTNISLKTLQQSFSALKLKYENLTKEHEKVNNVIQELEYYERELFAEKDLAQEKLNNEIERNKLRYDIERQTQFKNLNSKLLLREQEWEKEHHRKNLKKEKELERFIDEKELELNRKIQQAEKEVFEIHAKARVESAEIRESSEKILKEAYIERQRLLDEGSQEKMKAMSFVEDQVQASQLTAEKIRLEASEKLQEAQEFYKESQLNSKKLLDSAKTRGESILRKADLRKRSLIRNVQIENEQITKKLKHEEIVFHETIEKRKARLNNYLKIKRERVLQNIEDNHKVIKEKEVKLRLKLEAENEKIKRKQLKKIVFLKDQVVKKANESFDAERLKIKKLRKKELESLYKE